MNATRRVDRDDPPVRTLADIEREQRRRQAWLREAFETTFKAPQHRATKPVFADTGERWDSMRHFAEAVGIDPGTGYQYMRKRERCSGRLIAYKPFPARHEKSEEKTRRTIPISAPGMSQGGNKHVRRETPQQRQNVNRDSCVPSSRAAGRERCGGVPQRPRRGDDGRPGYQPAARCQGETLPDRDIAKPGQGGRRRLTLTAIASAPATGVGAHSGLSPGNRGAA